MNKIIWIVPYVILSLTALYIIIAKMDTERDKTANIALLGLSMLFCFCFVFLGMTVEGAGPARHDSVMDIHEE